MGKHLPILILFVLGTFTMTQAQSVVNTFTEDFQDTVSLDLWRPNPEAHPDGTPAFDVTQEDGVLKNVVSQVNFWDGQFFNFTTHEDVIFDISEYPFIAFDVKIEPGATYDSMMVETVPFLVSPWGPNADTILQREFLAIQMDVPADGAWHTITYDISESFGLPDWDGAIIENDYSEIQAILVENVIWPSTYAFSMEMDNFKVGEAAAPPELVTSYVEDFEETVSLDLWRPNLAAHPDGTPAFDVSQADGVLKNVVSQVNFWDGQFLNFTTNEDVIFDITDNPYISFDVKVEPGATYDSMAVETVPFLVSPWGPNEEGALQREFLAIQMDVPADGAWHTITYDISESFGLPDWDGAIIENDYSEIQAILVENVIWPSTYAFSMEMDNFKVGEAAAPPELVTSYVEDFEETVSLDLWRPNLAAHPDGTPAFDVSQADGVLKNVVSQVNFWDGQFLNFTTNEDVIFDITDNPYISFDVKVEPGATYDSMAVETVPFLVSPWGPNEEGALQREFLAIQMDVPADGAWHTITYDISESFGLPDWDGAIIENDYSEIQAILVENVIWPSTYAFSMEMDNFKVGDAAAPPAVVTSYVEDFEETVSLDLWRPNTGAHPDGTPAFDVSQADGVLKNIVSQVNFWDGQFLNFTANENLIFDITENPYISFDVKVEPGATYDSMAVETVPFLVSPWGPNEEGALQREFLAIQMDVPADGAWHTITYDISESFGLPDWDGAIIENDYSEIQAILVENVIWPSTYAFSMEMDNFKVGDAAAPPAVVTSYVEDFEETVSLDLWRPNTGAHPDGTPAFDVTQEDGVLKNIVNQVNFWDGQFLNFTTNENLIFDITENPYISFDVKVEPGATYDSMAVETVPFLVSPWGPNEEGALQREFLAIQMDVPADGAWHTITYDISESFGLPDWDGAIIENDYSEIQAILVENVIWPSTYAFSMEMDNFKVGDAAAPPAVVTSYVEDFEETVSLDLWRPNTGAHPDGTPAFDVTQEDGVLKNIVNQVNFWDGQFLNFTTNENLIFDITENPYIAFDVKVEPGATYDSMAVETVPFLVSPWGPNAEGALQREFLAIQMDVPADGEWHTITYDISESFGLPDWDGAIIENDYSEIQAILVENVIWPSTYAFSMEMDNFKVGDAAAPPVVVTSYVEDFEETVSLDLWRPNTGVHPDGTPAFDVTQEDGVLKNVVSQVNFWDGQFLNFTTNENLIFDITENPYIAFDVKVEPGATYDSMAVETVPFLVSPWGPNEEGALQREFLAIQMDVPADGEWHTITYNISDNFGVPDWDGAILENDYSEIQAILVENVIWPSTYAFSMEMDNFKVGDIAAPVGVKDLEHGLEFNVYPNPVGDLLTVTSEDILTAMSIYDMTGQLVAKKSFKNVNNFTFDISTFDIGMYILEINNGSKIDSRLISKN